LTKLSQGHDVSTAHDNYLALLEANENADRVRRDLDIEPILIDVASRISKLSYEMHTARLQAANGKHFTEAYPLDPNGSKSDAEMFEIMRNRIDVPANIQQEMDTAIVTMVADRRLRSLQMEHIRGYLSRCEASLVN
jgi:hypothetical protein